MKWELHVNLNDKLKRFFNLKYQFIKFILKFFLKNNNINLIIKQLIFIKLNNFKRYSYTNFSKNRCILSGRSYSVFKNYKLSRFFLRDEVNNRKISGFKRKSW